MKLLVVLLLAGVARGQDSSTLVGYLSLSPDQVSKLSANIRDYSIWLDGKQQRIGSLRGEIALETARDTPDPGELGWRYAEIEVTCRALFEERRQLQARNVAILNETQKVKWKALQDAMRLYPVLTQAQSASLLEGGPNGAYRVIYDPVTWIFTPPITACAGR